MNRRNFLKSLATACGAVVVCPGELLKDEPEWMKYARCFRPEHKIMLDKLRTASSGHLWMRGKDGSRIEGIITQGRQGRSGWIMFRGTPIFYQENLSA